MEHNHEKSATPNITEFMTFEIIGLSASAGYDKYIVGVVFQGENDARPLVRNEVKYARILIKHKKV